MRTPDGEIAGHNSIESLYDGCALHESWTGAKGSAGRSLNSYWERGGFWQQTWVDNSGGLLRLTGGLQANRMVLAGDRETLEGDTARHEISWEPLADGRVRQLWRVSADGGDNWTVVFDGYYTRTGK